jgi:hypothetical protein
MLSEKRISTPAIPHFNLQGSSATRTTDGTDPSLISRVTENIRTKRQISVSHQAGNASRRACNRLRHSKTIGIDRETPFSSNENDPPSVLPCCTMPHPDPNRPKLDSQLPPLRRNLPLRPMQIARLSRLARSKRAASLEAALSVCCHLHSMSASPLISPVENQYFGTPRHWLVSGDWARQGQRSDVDDSPLEGWRRRLHGFSTSPELRKNDDFPGHPKIVV